jgi:FixJ family two-component response regulator
MTKPSRVEGPAADEPVVFVVDDDPSMREALNGLFRSVGLRVEVFGSAPELLQAKLPEVASCLVLDIRLPMRSGLDFQSELTKSEIRIPIIFITAHGDVPMSVRAMKAGAVDFLTKPFRDQDLLDAVATAIERDRARRAAEEHFALKALFGRSPRGAGDDVRYGGLMNKQIAGEIGVSGSPSRSIAPVMRKMGAVAGRLVRMAEGGLFPKGAGAVRPKYVFPGWPQWRNVNPCSCRWLILVAAFRGRPLLQVPVVAVIDDDHSMRAATTCLIKSARLYYSHLLFAERFLKSEFVDGTSCVIADVQMPHVSGIELQNRLRARPQHADHLHHRLSGREGPRPRADGGAVCASTSRSTAICLIRCLDMALAPVS